MTTLTVSAIDQSTYVIIASFRDENGQAVEPNDDLMWTLTDTAGNVINDRYQVPIGAATSVSIVLHGADLAVDHDCLLHVMIEGTYNSDLGIGLEIRDQVSFTVRRLIEAIPPVVP